MGEFGGEIDMTKSSKRAVLVQNLVKDVNKWKLPDAVDVLKRMPSLKFDPTVTVSMVLGVDPKRPEHMVRGVFVLPHVMGAGTRVCVICSDEDAIVAIGEGAIEAGNKSVVEKIKNGWLEFDVLLTTPDMMREVSALGRILGPRNLMPSPKSGTIVTNVRIGVKEFRAGKSSFKMDKQRVVHIVVGKLSLHSAALEENVSVAVTAVSKAKPSSAKGKYLKKVFLSATMGAGLLLDVQ